MISTTSNAFQKLKDRARRKRFIANQVKNGFAFQVRALRKVRVMTQQELAREAETTQAVISRIEKNGATSLSVKTLQKIAEAFDVALVVRLEPIDRFLAWVDDLSPEAMAPRKSSEILSEMESAEIKESAPAPEVAAQSGHQAKWVTSQILGPKQPETGRETPVRDFTRAIQGTGNQGSKREDQLRGAASISSGFEPTAKAG